MKRLLTILLLLYGFLAISQQRIELTPNGFPTVAITKPNVPLENLMEAAKSWASYYNTRGADVYEVTSNSLKIDAIKLGAFHYYNLGERYSFNVKYTLAIEFGDTDYTLKFSVKEIYSNDKPLKSNLSNYFTPEGKLKEGFEEVKPSLESTVNRVLDSFASYLVR